VNTTSLTSKGAARRRFLCGTGALTTGIAASACIHAADTAAAPAKTAAISQAPGAPVPVRLRVNGHDYDLQLEPRVTLLDALRNRADLTGNKRVCDRGTCGACTMIVDGRTLYACSTLAIDVQGKPIRTVDGLASGNALHPVQQAFADHDSLMCGFCTPGFVVATVALLEKYPNPTRDQARHELDGNICRCGTFVRIMEAALSTKGVTRG
jgi:xanthine dehydrogenase YagT iron-sulfur-binding subunit